MARTPLTITDVKLDGGVNLTDTLEAANEEGESLAASSGDVTLVVANGSAGELTVTIKTPKEESSLAVLEDIWTIAAGQTYIGRFMDPKIYLQSDGTIHVDFSVHEDITVAAFKITK